MSAGHEEGNGTHPLPMTLTYDEKVERAVEALKPLLADLDLETRQQEREQIARAILTAIGEGREDQHAELRCRVRRLLEVYDKYPEGDFALVMQEFSGLRVTLAAIEASLSVSPEPQGERRGLPKLEDFGLKAPAIDRHATHSAPPTDRIMRASAITPPPPQGEALPLGHAYDGDDPGHDYCHASVLTPGTPAYQSCGQPRAAHVSPVEEKKVDRGA